MKHRIILTLAALLCLTTAFAGNFQVDDITLKPGETKDLKISLATTATNVVGVQFDVAIPEGLSLESINDLVYRMSANQLSDMICNVSSLDGNTYRFVLYSSSLQKLKSGELLFLNLKASNTTSLSKFTLNFTGIAFSDIDGKVTKENDVNAFANVSQKFTLSYLVDGEVYKSYEMEYGETITAEAAPTKEGYTFSGWSAIPKTMPAHDVTVTGSFIANKYKLIYKLDGSYYKLYDVEYGTEIIPEIAPVRTGYTFSGWSDIPETMPAHSVTVTGSFSINKYKLVYMVDNEEYKSYDIKYKANIYPEPEPTKEGYTFSGWSDIPATMPAKNVTITGTFKPIDYEVGEATYEVSNGEATIVGGEKYSGEVELSSTVVINGNTYSVTTISDGAFQNNTNITSATIPESVTNIGENAFDGCRNLSTIIIGKSVSSIGTKAFANINSPATTRSADGLKVVCYATSVPTTAADAFENTSINNATLLVDDSAIEVYKSTAPWSGFGTIMGINEAATGIDGILPDINSGARLFSIDGKPLNTPKKGIYIVRMNNGKTKKVVVSR